MYLLKLLSISINSMYLIRKLSFIPFTCTAIQKVKLIKSNALKTKPHAPEYCIAPKMMNFPSRRNYSDFRIGTSEFHKLVEKIAFIDKTMLIKDFLESKQEAILITSPRRFGKTTNLTMVKTFLEIEFDENDCRIPLQSSRNYKLFTESKGKILKISKEKNIINEYLGRYPVIFLSFADVTANDYNVIFEQIKVVISKCFRQHGYLRSILSDTANNEHLTYNQKATALDALLRFNKLHDDEAQQATLTNIQNSLTFLSNILYNVFKKRVFVLIDEYDKPMNSLINSDVKNDKDIEKVTTLINSTLGGVLKDNKYLEKGLMTGISLIAKNSASSELNNVKMYKFLDNHQFSKYYGFTDEEITILTNTDDLIEKLAIEVQKSKTKILNMADIRSNIQQEIKMYYNGYFVKKQNIALYNPWAIMNCFETGFITSDWCRTGSIEKLEKLFKVSPIRKIFKELITDDGIFIEFVEKPTVSHLQILHNLINCYEEDITDMHIQLFLSHIFELGYLTPTKQQNEEIESQRYKIPNKEIELEFLSYTKSYYISTYKLKAESFENCVNKLNAIFDLNSNNVSKKINNFENSLKILFQNLDFSNIHTFEADAHPNESLLHVITGFIVIQSKVVKFGSEVIYCRGFDKGRADIVAVYRDIGLIIELKFNDTAEKALKQIREKKYNMIFSEEKNIKKILNMGISLTSNKFINVKFDLLNNCKRDN